MATPTIQLWDKEYWNKGARRQLYKDYLEDEESARRISMAARIKQEAEEREQAARNDAERQRMRDESNAKMNNMYTKEQAAFAADLAGNQQAATDIRRHGYDMEKMNVGYDLGEKQADSELRRRKDFREFDQKFTPAAIEKAETMSALERAAQRSGIMDEEKAKQAAADAYLSRIAQEHAARMKLIGLQQQHPLLGIPGGAQLVDEAQFKTNRLPFQKPGTRPMSIPMPQRQMTPEEKFQKTYGGY